MLEGDLRCWAPNLNFSKSFIRRTLEISEWLSSSDHWNSILSIQTGRENYKLSRSKIVKMGLKIIFYLWYYYFFQVFSKFLNKTSPYHFNFTCFVISNFSQRFHFKFQIQKQKIMLKKFEKNWTSTKTQQNKYHEMFSRPAASATINLRFLARDLSRANNRRNSVNKEKDRYQPRHMSFQNNGGNRVQVDVARFFKNDAWIVYKIPDRNTSGR